MAGRRRCSELDEAALEQYGDGENPFGIEQAAMLMANFQQKAAMSGQDLSSIQAEPLISPHGPQLMEPNLPYPGSITLPQMHGWDQMLPQSVPKASSISSSVDAHHDLLPYPNGGSISSNSNTLPPLMDRQQSQTDALPSFHSSSMMNGLATPARPIAFP